MLTPLSNSNSNVPCLTVTQCESRWFYVNKCTLMFCVQKTFQQLAAFSSAANKPLNSSHSRAVNSLHLNVILVADIMLHVLLLLLLLLRNDWKHYIPQTRTETVKLRVCSKHSANVSVCMQRHQHAAGDKQKTPQCRSLSALEKNTFLYENYIYLQVVTLFTHQQVSEYILVQNLMCNDAVFPLNHVLKCLLFVNSDDTLLVKFQTLIDTLSR